MTNDLAKTTPKADPVQTHVHLVELIDDVYASIEATRVAFAEISKRQDNLVNLLMLIQSRSQTPEKVSQDLVDRVKHLEGVVNKQTCMLRRAGING